MVALLVPLALGIFLGEEAVLLALVLGLSHGLVVLPKTASGTAGGGEPSAVRTVERNKKQQIL